MAKAKTKRKLNAKPKSYLGIKIVVGLIGLVLSILAHELYHILMHWPYVTHIGLFPNHSAIVEILVWMPYGYDLEGEEIVAYLITLLIMLITVMIIGGIHDATDDRSSSQILFPKDKDMQKLSPAQMMALAGMDYTQSTTRKVKSRKKPRR